MGRQRRDPSPYRASQSAVNPSFAKYGAGDVTEQGSRLVIGSKEIHPTLEYLLF